MDKKYRGLFLISLLVYRGLFLISLLVFTFLPGLVPHDAEATAVIWTDKEDYSSGETVTLYGNGFSVCAEVKITITAPDESINIFYVLTDEKGCFTAYYTIDGKIGIYKVNATDGTNTAITTFSDPNPSADLDQFKNGKATQPLSPCEWVNQNLNEQHAHYIEGYSVPYRCVMENLPVNTIINITIGYDIKSSGKHAIDYLTSYNRINVPPHSDVFGHPPETINPLEGVSGVSSTISTFIIPAPSSDGSPVPGQPTLSYNSLIETEGIDSVKMTLFGGTILNITYVFKGNLTSDSSEAQIMVTFTVDNSTAVLAWGVT